MNILIFGGTGLIGRHLTDLLLKGGHNCVVVSRTSRTSDQSGLSFVRWSGEDLELISSEMAKADVLVNLVGETIGKWPWSKAHKARVLASRVDLGKQISEYYLTHSTKPSVLIQSSGIGYYGNSTNPSLDESAPNGSDFLASVAQQWERSTATLDTIEGVRRCIIRTALVLDRQQGVLPLMALPVRLFTGGPLGSGEQGISWIHLHDEARAIVHLINTPYAKGIFNLCTPQPLSNADFTRAIAKQLRRPYWFPVPAFLLKLVLGEMSDLLLTGQFAVPTRLLEAGFVFDFPNIDGALRNIYE